MLDEIRVHVARWLPCRLPALRDSAVRMELGLPLDSVLGLPMLSPLAEETLHLPLSVRIMLHLRCFVLHLRCPVRHLRCPVLHPRCPLG